MTPVIAIFDVGRTNKKLLLFDEAYQVLHETSVTLPETVDEDGFPCEDVTTLTEWIRDSAASVRSDPRWRVRACNVAAYGASFVHLDRDGKVAAPLYNYLKPYPPQLLDQFRQTYGDLSLETAAQIKDSLNSGLQLYRLKHEQPALYARVVHSLHLPQYLSYVLGGALASDITSIGCHTGLWDYGRRAYHPWVIAEGLDIKLPPLLPSDTCHPGGIGVGLHDSSAALIPYLRGAGTPFLQLSTGTWCVSLNPFNETPLTRQQLDQDCLCYIAYTGQPVKASRLFTGYAHEQGVRRLAERFEKPENYYQTVGYDPALLSQVATNFETAYHQLMQDLVRDQVRSTCLVLEGSPGSRILVDGGFSKNPIFMALLARAFPGQQVRAASLAQASALGAALCIHEHWNSGPLPKHVREG
jgi:L-fuculokinase